MTSLSEGDILSHLVSTVVHSLENGNTGRNGTSAPDTSDKEAHVILIIGFWLTGMLCVAGMLANVLAFMVLSRTTGCVMFHLLRSLAFADFFFLVGIFITQILGNLYPMAGLLENVYKYNGYLIKYVSPLVLVFQTTSIWLTVIVSVERCLAVCQPLLAHWICTAQKVNACVLLVFLVATLVNIPRFFEREVVRGDDNETFVSQDVIDLTRNKFYRYVYCTAVYFFFLFLIPMSVMTLFTVRLIKKIRRANIDWENFTRRPRRSSMTHKNLIALRKNESTITRISLLIIIIFIMCGTPDLVIKTLVIIWDFRDNIWIVSMTAVSNMLLVLNSACNFVIYCLVGRKFRTALAQSVRCACVDETAGVTAAPPGGERGGLHLHPLRSYSEMLPGEREEITLEETHALPEISAADPLSTAAAAAAGAHGGAPYLVHYDPGDEVFEETTLG